MARDNFSARTIRLLRDRAACLCSRPTCARVTVVPDGNDHNKVKVIGRAAHITAASEGGPRFEKSMKDSERKSASNGIWLCTECADLIDKDGGSAFDAVVLRGWKRQSERQVMLASLLPRIRRPVWMDALTSPHYINVPRLLHLHGPSRISHRDLVGLDGFPRNRRIVRELVAAEALFLQTRIGAVDLEEIEDPSTQVQEGLVFSYHRYCRTRNGDGRRDESVSAFSQEESPHIYTDWRTYRFLQPYDPAWITTRTAEASVRSGGSQMAGVAIVKAVDHTSRTVIASPLAFGIPDFFRMMMIKQQSEEFFGSQEDVFDSIA